MTLTAGNLGISGVDSPYFPGIGQFNVLNLRPWYWLIFGILFLVLFVNVRLRDSRLGRAWVALREDEVAAVSMGIPLVKTKLQAYAIGAAFGGMSGAFFGAYYTTVNAGQFAFGFSIFILAMVIIGGLGSIWGAVAGGLLLGYINYYLIPNVLNNLPSKFGLNFQLTSVEFGIFGFLLVLVMLLRPQGLIPERRRKLELTAEIGAQDAELAEPTAPENLGAIVVSAGSPVSAATYSPGASAVMRAEHLGQGVRRPGGGRRRLDRRARALDRVGDRAQRRRQDDGVQHAHRALQADLRPDPARHARHHPRSARRDHEPRCRPDVPEHPAVRRDDRGRERDGRPPLADASRGAGVGPAHAVGTARGARGPRARA